MKHQIDMALKGYKAGTLTLQQAIEKIENAYESELKRKSDAVAFWVDKHTKLDKEFDELKKDRDESYKTVVEPLTAQIVTLETQVSNLKRELEENEASQNLRWEADRRGRKMWQEKSGKLDTWPDHGDLVCFLMEKIDSMTTELGEKEVMCQAFDKVQKAFEGREWIVQGRGNYTYDDDGYKMEVRYLFDEFAAIKKDTWDNIQTKTSEYILFIKSQHESELKEKITDMFFDLKELKTQLSQVDTDVRQVSQYLDRCNFAAIDSGDAPGAVCISSSAQFHPEEAQSMIKLFNTFKK